jgi:hypothetical protein
MSRRRHRERGARTAAAAPLRPGPRRVRRLAWALPPLLVAGALLWGPAWRLATRPGAPPPNPTEPAALAAMSGEEALRTAMTLVGAGREAESPPYFRRALRDARLDVWQVRHDYAVGLYNTTMRIESRNGVPCQSVRSSWERIALAREAIRQLARAEDLAPTPRERAIVRASYAQLVTVWGMPWDAFMAFRQAHALDPASEYLASRSDGAMLVLRDPTRGPAAEPRPQGTVPR